jgi:hypothetical protein
MSLPLIPTEVRPGNIGARPELTEVEGERFPLLRRGDDRVGVYTEPRTYTYVSTAPSRSRRARLMSERYRKQAYAPARRTIDVKLACRQARV